MSITIELSSEQQAHLNAAARRNGIEALEMAAKLVTAHLPTISAISRDVSGPTGIPNVSRDWHD